MKTALVCFVALGLFAQLALVDAINQGSFFQGIPRNETRPDGSTIQIWEMDASPAGINVLLHDMFTNWWSNFTFGPLMPNVAYEVRAPNPALWIKESGGWLMIQFGTWHIHFCASSGQKTCTASVELYRTLTPALTAQGWGLRFLSGDGQYGMYMFLPHPWYEGDNKLASPDWTHLNLWYHLRRTYLGIMQEDPVDRTSKPFSAIKRSARLDAL